MLKLVGSFFQGVFGDNRLSDSPLFDEFCDVELERKERQLKKFYAVVGESPLSHIDYIIEHGFEKFNKEKESSERNLEEILGLNSGVLSVERKKNHSLESITASKIEYVGREGFILKKRESETDWFVNMHHTYNKGKDECFTWVDLAFEDMENLKFNTLRKNSLDKKSATSEYIRGGLSNRQLFQVEPEEQAKEFANHYRNKMLEIERHEQSKHDRIVKALLEEQILIELKE